MRVLIDLEDIRKEFCDVGLILKSTVYKNCDTYLYFICNKHENMVLQKNNIL